MAKLYSHLDEDLKDGMPSFSFECPGCGCMHGVWTKDNPNHNGAKWDFNGDINKPTFSPSIKVTTPQHNQTPHICHSFIKNGMIEYLHDCTHKYAGVTMELPNIDQLFFKPINTTIMAKKTKAAPKSSAKKTTQTKKSTSKQKPATSKEVPVNGEEVGKLFDIINQGRPDMIISVETAGTKITFDSTEHNLVLELLRAAVKNM